MLQLTPTPTTATARLKVPRPHMTIGGQSLAKTPNRGPRARAYQAARWVVGSLTIAKPTVALAALVFGVCEALVREEIRELEATTYAPPPIDSVWANMSAAERDAFVDARLNDLWVRFDRITAA